MDRLVLLHIEDDGAAAAIFRAEFRKFKHYRIEHVSSLGAAFKRIADGPPDLILMDLHLPDNSGLRGLQTIYKQYPELPIIVFTGFPVEDPMIAAEALKLGAQDIYGKDDVSPEQLERAIRLAIQRKRTENRRVIWSGICELTKLPMAQSLDAVVVSSIARSIRAKKHFGLLYIRIDDIPSLRDDVGDTGLDEIVRIAGERLSADTRRADKLARQGECDFVVFAEMMDKQSDINNLAERVLSRFADPFYIYGQSLQLTLSIGLSVTASPSARLADLMTEAADSMARQNRCGGNGFVQLEDLVMCPVPAT